MKLSKTSWIILTVGMCLIAFSSVGAARAQRLEEQTQLREELSVAELRLSKLSTQELSDQQEKLKNELSQTIAQLENVKAEFSQLTDSINASDRLFEIAGTCGVEITEIISPILTTERLEEISYSALPINVKAEGQVTCLISFINELSNNLGVGSVKSAEINVPSIGMAEEPTADINLVIYIYEGG
ncbi:MAG: hypothetical protein FJ025_01750 [Chloroflexi bacterium]|nr:hypothetical protein [Chloroflexota bacterium]